MFTGIIQTMGTVRATSEFGVVINCPGCGDEPDGASIAVNGCCLTVAGRDGDDISFDVLPETLAHTNIGDLAVGAGVNLEPALRAGDALGGHWVQGHVDATGTVEEVDAREEAQDVWLDVPAEVGRYCIERGSLTVNGVSLTIMEQRDAEGGDGAARIRVQLIPETRARTNLGALRAGVRVNLEADILARYVERMLVLR
jgi:riboflavin synthase